MNSEMLKKYSRRLGAAAVIGGLFLYGVIVFAAGPFEPGVTLDPAADFPADCSGPSDPDCYVAAPDEVERGTGAPASMPAGTDPVVYVNEANGDVYSWDGTNWGLISAGGVTYELYGENPLTPTTPSATGDNAISIGSGSTASGTGAIAIGSSLSPFYSGPVASGDQSLALGLGSTASGQFSTAFGFLAQATGANSFAFGVNNGAIASGGGSMAFGDDVTASGNKSYGFGRGIRSASGDEISLGTYNTIYTPINTAGIDAADRQFTIGNGTSTGARSDAFTILKNGEVGIGIDNFETNTSTALLQVGGAIQQTAVTSCDLAVDVDGLIGCSAGGGGGGTPAGTDGQIQFNDGGTAFGASSDLFWDDANSYLGIGTVTPTVSIETTGDIKHRSSNTSVYEQIMGAAAPYRLTDPDMAAALDLEFRDPNEETVTISLPEPDDVPHALLYAKGMLFMGVRSEPGMIIRYNNPEDLTDIDTVTFANDGLHDMVEELIYVPETDKLYAIFGDITYSINRIVVAEIDPDTLAVTDVISDTTSGLRGGSPSIVSDGEYLYVLTSYYNSRVVKYDLATFTKQGSVTIPSPTSIGHNIFYDGEKLFAASNYGTVYLARINPDTLAIEQQKSLGAIGGFSGDAAMYGEYIFAGRHINAAGQVYRFEKDDLDNFVILETGYAATVGGEAFDGENILVLLDTDPGIMLRIDPITMEYTVHEFEAGFMNPGEFATDGQRYFITSSNSTGDEELKRFVPANLTGPQNKFAADGSIMSSIDSAAETFAFGAATASYLMHATIDGTGAVAGFTNADATCTINPTTAALDCSSDERLKKNVTDIDSVLDDLFLINPVRYNWNTEEDVVEKKIGFIAQNVNEVFPELVSEDANGYLSLNYAGLTPVLTKAIQELDLKIADIEARADLTVDGESTTLVNFFKKFLADTSEKIIRGVQQIFAKEAYVEKLCVGTVCFEEDQLRQLFDQNGIPYEDLDAPIIEPEEEPILDQGLNIPPPPGHEESQDPTDQESESADEQLVDEQTINPVTPLEGEHNQLADQQQQESTEEPITENRSNSEETVDDDQQDAQTLKGSEENATTDLETETPIEPADETIIE